MQMIDCSRLSYRLPPSLGSRHGRGNVVEWGGMSEEIVTPTFVWQCLLRDFLAHAARPLVVILGPTASGKTAFSLEVAKELQRVEVWGEIVNADSRQLYRFLDIGTAKVLPSEMQSVPHHLLDVLDPQEEVTIAWYKEHAQRAIDDILARGAVPLLVGGSMLYLSAIIDGLEPPSASDPAIRKRLENAYEQDEGATLYKRLEELDPESAAAIHRRNKPYLVRSLEIAACTGQRPSSVKRTSNCPYTLLIFGMDLPRLELHRRIHTRVAAMFARGWVEEVRSLLARGYNASSPGLKSHGYREIAAFLERGDGSLAERQSVISRKTVQYAKRQRTWWRRDPRIHWLMQRARRDSRSEVEACAASRDAGQR